MENTDRTIDLQEAVASATPEQSPAKAQPAEKRFLFSHRFGLVDRIVLAICCACIICGLFIGVRWLKWVLSAVSMVCLFGPWIFQDIQTRRHFGLSSIYREVKKMGLNPEYGDKEVKWEYQGKMNIARLQNGCQLQIVREYPSQPGMREKFESAASTTMDEVFSAKVGVRQEEEGAENIFFSTEMFCTSSKEFSRLLPATVRILDTAEDRQGANLRDILKAEMDREDVKPSKKIGFIR